MSHTTQIILNAVGLTASVVVIVWFLWRWLKGSREPELLVVRWVLTALALGGLAYAGASGGDGLSIGSIFAVLFASAAGLFLAIVWVPVMVDAISRAFGSLYTGGDVEVEARPYYSVFHARRNKGKHLEALTEIRAQLDKFPNDFEGHMLLAQLQAENLNDLAGAEVTINRLVNQPGHLQVNLAYALNQLADWHLQINKDRDAAQLALERIPHLLPDTEMALQAAQRIGKLAGTEALLASQDRQSVVLKKGVENIGLLDDSSHLKRPDIDYDEVAGSYVKHLQSHPLDTEVREKLAVVYANHYHRLDMALDQLEQLVNQPNQPPKQIVRWLNLMVDLLVSEGADFERIRETLQRIVDLFPDHPAAENSRRRIDRLRLEMKAKEKTAVVQLGTYEQNIGLKGRA